MSKALPEKMKNVLDVGEEECDQPVVNNRNVYLAAVSSLMYMFAAGMTAAYPAQATEDMKRPGSRLRHITSDEITWIGSLNHLGAIPAHLLAGYFTHKFGRKAVLMLSSGLFVSSWIMIAYAPTVAWIYIGRVISGICTGLYVVAVQAYVTEIAPQNIRGLLSSGFPFAASLGILAVDALGIVLRWSWLAVSIAVVCAISACMMLFMPESPVWLVKESRISEAMKGISFLKGRNFDSKKEVQVIIKSFSHQQDVGKLNYKEFSKPILYKPFIISILFMFFYQTSGVAPVLTYTVHIFQNAGSSVPPMIATIILAGVQSLANVLTAVTVDKFGRRKLYIASGIGTTITLFVLGTYSYVIYRHPDTHHLFGYIPLISLIAFTFAFNFGLGSIPFVMISEMVSIRYRSTVLSIVTFFVAISNFVILKIYDTLRTALGDYGLYYTYSCFTFISILFGYFFLPETKNRPIEEISKHFTKS